MHNNSSDFGIGGLNLLPQRARKAFSPGTDLSRVCLIAVPIRLDYENEETDSVPVLTDTVHTYVYYNTSCVVGWKTCQQAGFL